VYDNLSTYCRLLTVAQQLRHVRSVRVTDNLSTVDTY
jgi:hypothetical protein